MCVYVGAGCVGLAFPELSIERCRHEDEVLAARCENVLAVVSNVDADDGVCA